MTGRAWQKWDTGDVAEIIEAYWERSSFEVAHRDALAQLISLHIAHTNGRVLEVGCGSGQIYKRLFPAVVAESSYVGIDISEKMLKIAKRNFANARFARANGFQLCFQNNAFETVLCFEVLGHLANIETFITELFRVTGKRCVFSVWHSKDADIVEGHERIDGVRFMHRKYSHSYMERVVSTCQPGLAKSLEVAVLSPENWVYIVEMKG